mgnify:CR=1 FL=1
MKLTKKQLNNLIRSTLLEDTHKIKSSIVDQQTDGSKSGSSQKTISNLEDTNVDTGDVVKIKTVQGQFPNGLSYGSEDASIKSKDGTSTQKFLSITNKSGKSVGVGHGKDKSGKTRITLFKDGKIIKNPLVVLGHFFMMGINPLDVIKVIKEINTDIDTSELEKEMDKK